MNGAKKCDVHTYRLRLDVRTDKGKTVCPHYFMVRA